MTHAEQEANSLGTDGSLKRYLEDIRDIPMLSREDEVTLATRVRSGDTKARGRLVQANLRFVVSVAKRYQHRGLSLIDLIAEGNLGLVKAVDHFDETLGYKFISYAVWWIKQAIIQSIYKQARPMRLPYSRANLLFKLERANGKLEQERGGPVPWTDLAAEVEASGDDVEEMLALAPRVSSLDGTVGDDDLQLLEVLSDPVAVGPEDEFVDQTCSTQLVNALNDLDERERHIVNRFFGLGEHERQTLEQIGMDYSLTRERIRQIKDRALKKLRAQRKELREYLVA
jgi:RNA polymerase primary sigma factor